MRRLIEICKYCRMENFIGLVEKGLKIKVVGFKCEHCKQINKLK